MADAPDSESGARKGVEVQVLFRAKIQKARDFRENRGLFVFSVFDLAQPFKTRASFVPVRLNRPRNS